MDECEPKELILGDSDKERKSFGFTWTVSTLQEFPGAYNGHLAPIMIKIDLSLKRCSC